MEGNPLRPSTRNVEERQESEYANYGSLPKGWMLAQISDIKPLTFHVFCCQPYESDINRTILTSTMDFLSQNRTFDIRLSSGRPPELNLLILLQCLMTIDLNYHFQHSAALQ